MIRFRLLHHTESPPVEPFPVAEYCPAQRSLKLARKSRQDENGFRSSINLFRPEFWSIAGRRISHAGRSSAGRMISRSPPTRATARTSGCFRSSFRLRLPPPAAPCRSRARRASITQCRDWSASPANRANAVRVRARPRSAAAWVRYWSGFAAWG